MRTGRCKHCNGTYTYDDYGPGKECDCPKIKWQKTIEDAARKWCDQFSWNNPKEEDAHEAFIAGVNWAVRYFGRRGNEQEGGGAEQGIPLEAISVTISTH